jgi:hemerythrin-like domain-containing protein
MEPTEILMAEHRVIEQVLAALKKQSEALQSGGAVRAGFFLEAGEFIRNYVQDCHQRKEEAVLFPAMVDGGLSKYTGPVAIFLAEHARTRVYIVAMTEAARHLETGAPTGAVDTVRNALAQAALKQQHIQREDSFLFPMALRVLPQERHAQVIETFEKVDRELGGGVHEKYRALAASLAIEAGI